MGWRRRMRTRGQGIVYCKDSSPGAQQTAAVAVAVEMQHEDLQTELVLSHDSRGTVVLPARLPAARVSNMHWGWDSLHEGLAVREGVGAMVCCWAPQSWNDQASVGKEESFQ